jgi:hypothetical protein
MSDIVKYPRTQHLAGSKLQPGDEDLQQVSLSQVVSQHPAGSLVWEEKVDGANAAFSFLADGTLQLQSRGHVLRGGSREAQFALFKAWVETHRAAFWAALRSRFIVFGEWCYAKHTVFYDALPHYFLEFDVYDREQRRFLSTPVRRDMLGALPIVSVPVIHEGNVAGDGALRRLVVRSQFKSTAWRSSLADAARASGQSPERVAQETDMSDLAEGLYLKHEHADGVIGRYKFLRADFLQTIAATGSHWQDRPIVPNQLAPEVDLFA